VGREKPHSVASIPARGSNQRETRRGVSLLINDSEWFESLSQHGTWSNRISRSLLFHLLHISVANSHWMEWNINWPKRFSITMMGKGEGRRFLTRVFIHIIQVYLFVFILFATWRQMCLFVFFKSGYGSHNTSSSTALTVVAKTTTSTSTDSQHLRQSGKHKTHTQSKTAIQFLSFFFFCFFGFFCYDSSFLSVCDDDWKYSFSFFFLCFGTNIGLLLGQPDWSHPSHSPLRVSIVGAICLLICRSLCLV
jgi:hypothetical protein